MQGRVDYRIAADFIRKVEAGFDENEQLVLGSLKTDWGTIRVSRSGTKARLLIDDSEGTREVSRLPGILKIGIARSLAESVGLLPDLDAALKLSASPLVIERLRDDDKVIPFPSNHLKRN